MAIFLIAEDEKPLARALEHKLKDKGHSVLLAETGKKALELLQTNHPDAILLDLIMPEADGFEVLTELQQQASTPPIIVCSNLAQPEDTAKALSLGAHGFISKADASLEEIVVQLESLATQSQTPTPQTTTSDPQQPVITEENL